MLQNFGTALSREEMKMVVGGDGSQYCADTIDAAGGRWISHDGNWGQASFGTKMEVIGDGDMYCHDSCMSSCCAAVGC